MGALESKLDLPNAQTKQIYKLIKHRSMSKKRSMSKSRSLSKTYPQGTWIKTARNYYVKNNILYAQLKQQNGIYVDAQTHFTYNDIYENFNGKFVLVGKRRSTRKRSRSSRRGHSRRHSRSFSRHKSTDYLIDNFNIYYRGRKLNISPLGFRVLGDGYAQNNFIVLYKGDKVSISTIGFRVLGDGYAQDNFKVIYKGEKVNISTIGFRVLGNGYAQDNFHKVYKGKLIK